MTRGYVGLFASQVFASPLDIGGHETPPNLAIILAECTPYKPLLQCERIGYGCTPAHLATQHMGNESHIHTHRWSSLMCRESPSSLNKEVCHKEFKPKMRRAYDSYALDGEKQGGTVIDILLWNHRDMPYVDYMDVRV